jgi:hypothetical protein
MTPFDEISEIYFWYFVLIIAIAAMVVYVAPSIIALKRKIRNKEILVVLNLILGWTLAGWVGCLIYSLVEKNNDTTLENNKYTKIIRLQELKDRGALTEEEFANEKAKLLEDNKNYRIGNGTPFVLSIISIFLSPIPFFGTIVPVVTLAMIANQNIKSEDKQGNRKLTISTILSLISLIISIVLFFVF